MATLHGQTSIDGTAYTTTVWPNQMGEDIDVASGTIEILWPVDLPSSEPFRARYIPNGETVSTMAGEARNKATAVWNMEPRETWPGLEPTAGGRPISFKD